MLLSGKALDTGLLSGGVIVGLIGCISGGYTVVGVWYRELVEV